ncbi:MAG: response regulator [Planctomycetota bacterium]
MIDDDPVYRELLTIGLGGEGYQVLLAENGEGGKEILQRETVDLVLVDMLMPLMDGLRFLHWVRKEEELTLPVLVVTSQDNRNLSVEALVAGATDVVVKPVSLPVLLEKLSSLLGARQGEQASRPI